MSARLPLLGRTGPAACAVGILAVAVYANTLRHGFASDDLRVIVDNPAVRDPSDWRRIFMTPSWFMDGEATTAFRPLTTWTFAASYAVHGAQPVGYHVVNVLLHAIVSMLLVVLAATMGMAAPIPALAGALFAVHPIHTEVVANGVGRAELLAAASSLVALALARMAGRSARSGPWMVACVVAYGLALLSKEHTISLLLLLPLSDLLIADGGSGRRFVARLHGARLLSYGGLGAMTVGYLALRVVAVGSVTGALAVGDRVGGSYNPTLLVEPSVRVLTALGVQARALWLVLWPISLSADYSYPQVVVVTGATDPTAVVGVGVAIALVVAMGLAWRHRPTAAIWLALALLPWVVVSNLIVPIGTIFGERLLYLPSAGVCVLLATGLVAAASRVSKTVIAVAVGALVLGWSARTVTRNRVWESDLTLAEATVADAPRSANAHASLGRVYSDLRRDDEALAHFDVVAHLLEAHPAWPERLDVLYETALVRQRRGEVAQALALYREIVARDPRYFPAWINRGALANQIGDHREALEAADRAAAIRPDLSNVDLVRGFALRGLGRHREALESFRAVLARVPGAPQALLGVGASAIELEDFGEAARTFEALVAVSPSRDAYRGLVMSLRGAGRSDEAGRVAERARLLHPDDPVFQAAP